MKVIYNPTTDVLRIVFREAIIEDFSEDQPGVTIDYDADDKIVGLEIQEASKIIEDPRSSEHFVISEVE